MGRTLFFLLMLAGAAHALDAPEWPPPAADAARMRELQQVIASAESTREQRDAARTELARMMMAPSASGPLPHTRPRAAIDPAPPVKAVTVPMPASEPPEVARLEVVRPSQVDPGVPVVGLPVPAGRTAIDPRTGHVIQKTPAGYVDTVTGQLVPR
jgi:hypothetical protein